MTRILLALVTMLSASAALAKSYVGTNDAGQDCVIYFKKQGANAVIAIGDETSAARSVVTNQTIVSRDGKVVTYSVVRGNKVLADVAIFKGAGLITATKYPMSYKGFCK